MTAIHSSAVRRLALIALLGAVLAGCGGEKTVSPTPETIEGTVPQAPQPQPPAAGDATAGKAVYDANGCGGCHTFKPAGSTGTTGPDLDNLAEYAEKAGKPLPSLHGESITDPDAYVEEGFPSGVMPPFKLPPKQLADLVAFLTQAVLIDLRAARNDPDRYRADIARKGGAEAFDELLEADARWRELVPQVDDLRGRQKLKGKPTPEQVEELKQVKEDLRRLEEELTSAESRRDELLQRVPNPPHESVPDGDTEEDAREERVVGEPGPESPEHLELGWFDMERGARLSGSRFGYIAGDAALLALAVYRWALDRAVVRGLHAGPAARARARGGDVRHRLLPRRAERVLRDLRGRAST